MPGLVTDPRFIAATAVGLDWQGAEGEAVPGTPFTPAQFIVVQNFGRDPDPTYLQPDGTHGAIFQRRDGARIISQAFKKELTVWGSRMQVLPFIESALSGQPTVADADNTRSGAGAASITAFSLIGARPYHNLAPLVTGPVASLPAVTIGMVDAGGGTFPVTVTIYKDAAKTITVATATVAAAATPTPLVASGTSGLTGSIELSAAVTLDALAVINKIILIFANQFTRFFRLFYSDGDETVVLSDCVVNELMFESTENGELVCTASVMGKRRQAFPAQTLTVLETQLDLVSLSHSELTLTKDVGGTPVVPVVDNFSLKVANNVMQYIGNSPTPQKLIKQGHVVINGTIRGEASDETMGLVLDARANTAVLGGMFNMRADYILATKTLRFDMPVSVRQRLSEPGIAAELVEKVDLEYDVLYDGITQPLKVEVDV